jgi:hypothetical protein
MRDSGAVCGSVVGWQCGSVAVWSGATVTRASNNDSESDSDSDSDSDSMAGVCDDNVQRIRRNIGKPPLLCRDV